MANITSYPTATPTGSDLVIGTDMSTTPISTKTFTIDSINSLAYDATFPFVFNTTSKNGIQSTGNTASGDSSLATGRSTIASGNVSTAIGESTTASGISSTAMGAQTTSSGTYSTAMGYRTAANGQSSTAMGDDTTASGESSIAMGSDTIASGTNSTAMGFFTTASGSFSTAMGDNTTAFGYASTAIGRFNVLNTGDNATAYAATNTAFSIGNGTAEVSRSDAFKVLFNGTTTIAGSITGTSIIKSGGASTEYLMADGSVTAASYKVYTALLTQTGTAAPVAIILDNTTGGTITWSRTSAGIYVATISGSVFTVDKTIVFNNNGSGGASSFGVPATWVRTSDTQITTTSGDGRLVNGSFEIRVYT